MNILLSKSAITDPKDIQAYYLAQDVPQTGQEFVASMLEHIETLTSHPDIGRVVPEFGDTSIRELIHTPFRIVYLREPQAITIIRVWRSERNLKLPESTSYETK